MKRLCTICLVGLFAGLIVLDAGAGFYTGSLSTPPAEGLYSDGITWAADEEGLTVIWEVSQNANGTWHYKYTFTNGIGDPLGMLVSHFIISVSDDLTGDQIFNFSDDVADFEIKTFGPEDPANPGIPGTIWGLKLELGNAQLTAAFDSTRAPMWGDFYAKDGGVPVNWAYNTDFGKDVANLHDYWADDAVDAEGDPLFKILVPNTLIPEPATLALLGLGGVMSVITRKRKTA